MKYGVCMFPTDYAMNPAELGPKLEERGFESLWVAEHTHIPCSRESPWPGGAELPKMYYDCFAPLLTLAAVGATTKTLKLGTGIQLVAQHDPITLAKEIATLDQMTGGRFLFGVGGGWNREELANHYDFPFERRWKVMRERIEAMKAIWTQDKAAYHGEFVNFDEIFSWPKPVQKPNPPIHVGGAAPWGIKRALRYGDGWIPLSGRGDSDPISDMKQFRTMAKEAGRDPDSMEVSLYVAPTDETELSKLSDAGYSRVLFIALPLAGDDMTKMLDTYAEAGQKI
ncbi:MAG: LLM class F420-dependent oxidoreductase [Candidatus Binatia bacterium]|nr:LLM class F420-dependent oxidoreductase [Candidatus Binatia bacterium]